MTMINPAALILALAAGALLGVVFFGGLKLTVQKGLTSKRPYLWFIGSFLARTAIVLSGFYLVSRSDLYRLLACIAGFIAARIVMTRRVWQQESNRDDPGSGDR